MQLGNLSTLTFLVGLGEFIVPQIVHKKKKRASYLYFLQRPFLTNFISPAIIGTSAHAQT